ncbi:MAG: hypothetical protein ACR2ML_04255 [Solirubrobacteraceae bacterium]
MNHPHNMSGAALEDEATVTDDAIETRWLVDGGRTTAHSDDTGDDGGDEAADDAGDTGDVSDTGDDSGDTGDDAGDTGDDSGDDTGGSDA